MIPLSQTVDIGNGRGRLAPHPAESIARVDLALGRPLDVNSAWRDPVLQQSMFVAWTAWFNGKGPKPDHGRALPASQSAHCAGKAIDTDDWLLELLNEHGWYRTAIDEGWHFEYFEHLDKHRNNPAPTRRRTDMLNIAYIPKGDKGGHPTKNVWIQYGPGFYHEFTGDTAGKQLAEQAGAPAAKVSRAWADGVRRQAGVTQSVDIVNADEIG